MTISEMITNLSKQGVTLSADGDTLRWNAPPSWPTTKRLAFLRTHKAKIMAYLADIPEPDKSINRPAGELAGFSELELAMNILSQLIPNEQNRRRIKSLAEAEARNWLFLGDDNYQHILAGDIVDAVEKVIGKTIGFEDLNEAGQFTRWHLLEKKACRDGKLGSEDFQTRDDASIGPRHQLEPSVKSPPPRKERLF